MPVLYSRRAMDDLRDIRAWAGSEDPAHGRAVVRAIAASIELLEEYPRLGRPNPRGTRLLVITKVPYVAIYRLRARHVEILHIRHQAARR